ncbi:MAG TPA: restriction endonuclease [Planctomycetales bacterium]|nr:restriction endonuclease [Planctomycetales bacterium]
MAIPDFQSVMLPILEALQDGQERKMREVTETLAVRLKLTDEERQELLPSGQQTVFSNRVAWAKSHLKNAGLIENPVRGKVSIAEAGRKVLLQKPATVNCKFLKQFSTYLKFIGHTTDQDNEGEAGTVIESSQTPLELLDASFNTLQKATAQDLMAKLKTCSPGFFEQVVVRLLRAMGYGGVTGDASVTGKSGDGGIDGIIKEDKLGLDVVCIQAKRWDGSVGRPVIQGFVGSMDYIRAKKGVILTTSQFTKDALDFVDRIEGKKVVLIDGPKLADLMIEHNVGVKLTKLYELKEVSNDFFDEDEG